MKSLKRSDYRAVTLTGGFWKQKEDLNRDVTIDDVYGKFYDSGRIDAFRCEWKQGDDKQPHFYWDSDVVKWMEGAAYCLSRKDDPELLEKVENLIDLIDKNREECGYFNIYYTVVEPGKKFSNRDNHELYCAGHLMEAAVAYYEATGKRRFLDIAEKYAYYIKSVFVDGTGDVKPAFLTPGHQEIEIALYRMYRCTGNADWLEMAKFFLDKRGNNEVDTKLFNTHDWAPVREQHEASGHAVRAGYMYSAMADIGYETDDSAMLESCLDIWRDIVERKMYVTGGVGSCPDGETFGEPYNLPNDTAYSETCASISMMFFSHRMNKIYGESKYADVIERTMYNSMISGLSLKGNAYFYDNLLEINLIPGGDNCFAQRPEMFWCSCCPPNLNRTLSSMGQYFYMWEEGDVWVNQFGESEFAADGMSVKQKTDYPVSGKVTITAAGTKNVRVRVPGWCDSFSASREYVMDKGYAVFAGEGEITVDFEMKPMFIHSDNRVRANRGRVAVQCGPVVYCAEDHDNPCDVRDLYLDVTNPEFAAEKCDTCGLNKLFLNGYRRVSRQNGLYSAEKITFEPIRATLIPYHTFANRSESNMAVHLLYR